MNNHDNALDDKAMLEKTRTARLPAWAQNRIHQLEQDLAGAREHIALLSDGPADSDVIAHDYEHPDRLLGRGVIIRFLLGTGYIEVSHGREKSGYLELRTGGGALISQPLYGNVIRIREGGFWGAH